MFEVQCVGTDKLGCNSHTSLILVACNNSTDSTCNAHAHVRELPVPSSLSGFRRAMFSLSISNRVKTSNFKPFISRCFLAP